jgi:hypothetical protein
MDLAQRREAYFIAPGINSSGIREPLNKRGNCALSQAAGDMHVSATRFLPAGFANQPRCTVRGPSANYGWDDATEDLRSSTMFAKTSNATAIRGAASAQDAVAELAGTEDDRAELSRVLGWAMEQFMYRIGGSVRQKVGGGSGSG